MSETQTFLIACATFIHGWLWMIGNVVIIQEKNEKRPIGWHLIALSWSPIVLFIVGLLLLIFR